jgi:hypothetical protein
MHKINRESEPNLICIVCWCKMEQFDRQPRMLCWLSGTLPSPLISIADFHQQSLEEMKNWSEGFIIPSGDDDPDFPFKEARHRSVYQTIEEIIHHEVDLIEKHKEAASLRPIPDEFVVHSNRKGRKIGPLDVARHQLISHVMEVVEMPQAKDLEMTSQSLPSLKCKPSLVGARYRER